MSRDARLRQAVEETTGEVEILDVAEFAPTEPDHAFIIPETGSDDGDPHVELPRHVALAVTPSRVHVLGIPHGFWSKQPTDAYLIATIDRRDLEVRVTRRLTDRLLTLVDHATDTTLDLAASHLSRHRPKVLCELLLGGPDESDGGR